jgi:acetolactate synthase I/II/III large subunit
MRVSDYIAKVLADFGVRHVFMLTGGGAMFLNDAFGYEGRIQCVFNHHEQACAMAAEGYARITGQPGVINVTTGPGGINAMNGVFGAWTDSIPMLVVSGQVKRETLLATYNIPGLRQIGDQEADTISMVKPITKYAVLVDEPATIRYHLEKAWYLAQHGRPGPVWLDIPIDVQTSQVDPQTLAGYTPNEPIPADEARLPEICTDALQMLISAERPVILAGKGIRLGKALGEFEQVIRSLDIPVVTGWTSIDLITSDDPLFCGRPGDLGTRAGNFTVQNADVLLVLGNRLGLRQVSYNWNSFARFAFKILVDIDEVEFLKPTVKLDLAIHSDVKLFLKELERQIEHSGYQPGKHADWLTWCKERVTRYPSVLPRHRENKDGRINPYYFIEQLSAHLNENDVVVCGNGTANVVAFQALFIKKGQRIFANTGDASMGYDLPAAIGAAVAREGKRVICLAGDGSLQLNIQELQTIVQNQLPIKLFILNNEGYLSIRLSQKNMFKRLTGEGPKSGVSFPDIVKIAEAYGIPARRIGYDELEKGIQDVLAQTGPVVCDVLLDPDQPFEPRISSKQLPDGRIVSSNLEEMYPFLDDQELAENMIAPFNRQ